MANSNVTVAHPLIPGERINFAMRSYQYRTYLALQAGKTRFVERLHRRAGKDRNWMNLILIASMQRIGNYIHVFPALNMGRRDVWENVIQEKKNGVEHSYKMIDMFPAEFIRRKLEDTMLIEFIWGSTYQIMGADDDDAIDRMRGPNPVGIVRSERAFMNSKVDRVLEPVLLENKGWCVDISTPNVEGDDFDLLCDFAAQESLRPDSKYFFQSLTIEDTLRDAEGEDGTPVITKSDIDELRRKGVREEEIQREYYCNNKGYRHGTIYGDLINTAILQNRIARFAYNPMLPVGVCFDLGYSPGDKMALWCYQRPNPSAIYFINYHEETQGSLATMSRWLKEQTNYKFGRTCLPHDGKSAREYLETVGFKNVEVAPRPLSIQQGIDDVRNKFSQFYFDSANCSIGIEHMTKYHYEWDNEKRIFIGKPVHDEHSHGADALRSGVGCGFDPLEFLENYGKPIKVETSFDPTAPYDTSNTQAPWRW